MAPIEGDLFYYREGQLRSETSFDIVAGSYAKIDHFAPAEIRVFADSQDFQGRVIIEGKSDHLSDHLRVYCLDDQTEYEVFDHQKIPPISGKQKIVIFSYISCSALLLQHNPKDQRILARFSGNVEK